MDRRKDSLLTHTHSHPHSVERLTIASTRTALEAVQPYLDGFLAGFQPAQLAGAGPKGEECLKLRICAFVLSDVLMTLPLFQSFNLLSFCTTCQGCCAM